MLDREYQVGNGERTRSTGENWTKSLATQVLISVARVCGRVSYQAAQAFSAGINCSRSED